MSLGVVLYYVGQGIIAYAITALCTLFVLGIIHHRASKILEEKKLKLKQKQISLQTLLKHRELVVRAEELIAQDVEPGSDGFKELEQIVKIITDYEEKND